MIYVLLVIPKILVKTKNRKDSILAEIENISYAELEALTSQLELYNQQLSCLKWKKTSSSQKNVQIKNKNLQV